MLMLRRASEAISRVETRVFLLLFFFLWLCKWFLRAFSADAKYNGTHWVRLNSIQRKLLFSAVTTAARAEIPAPEDRHTARVSLEKTKLSAHAECT